MVATGLVAVGVLPTSPVPAVPTPGLPGRGSKRPLDVSFLFGLPLFRRPEVSRPGASPGRTEAPSPPSRPRLRLETFPTPTPRVTAPSPERVAMVAEPDTTNVPGLTLHDLQWRIERAKKGSAYANMKPGQILPGRRTVGEEGPPKMFKSRAEWRWSFWQKRPDSKTRAHARPWKSLPRRKGKKTDG